MTQKHLLASHSVKRQDKFRFCRQLHSPASRHLARSPPSGRKKRQMHVIQSVSEICTWKKLSGSIPSFYKFGNQGRKRWAHSLKDPRGWD